MTGTADDPDPRKQSIASMFGRGANDYDQVGEFFTPIGRDLVSLAGVSPGERVLDVGCGRGAVLFAAADAVGASGQVVGIDLAERMVALTAADAEQRGLPNVTVAVGDADRPDFAPGSFDAVLASFVLFFLPDPEDALKRLAGLLAPGGRLGFTSFARNDPNFEAAMGAVESYVPGGLPPRGARQGPFGSPESITAVVTSAGFASPTIGERSYETRFATVDEWLAWAWSHGGRATLERVPAQRLDEATSAAKAAFGAARTPAGDYVIRTAIRFTVARPAD
jgi:ubiquinone/menaquinone biosynthesis C-methylase UbiE